MAMTLSGDNGVTFNDASLQGAAASPYVLKNRIINGAMVVDQRNAGASVTPTNTQYTLDRWRFDLNQASKFTVQQNAGAVTPPVGFSKYLGVTSSSAYSVGATDYFTSYQPIEGFNTADLSWGTANAKTITISAWVRSSLTGTFGGTVFNENADRCYVFTYSIPTANTWTQISVTIAGDTSGTWTGATNGIGMYVGFAIGAGSTVSGTAGIWGSTFYRSATGATSVVGTSGATLYITGVQLEIGSSATPFERRLYGQELANCQRYYEKSYAMSVVPGANNGFGSAFSTQNVGVTTASFILTWVNYKVSKRTDATVSVWDTVGNSGKCTRFTLGSSTSTNQSITIDAQSESAMEVYSSTGSNSAGIALQWTASAEL